MELGLQIGVFDAHSRPGGGDQCGLRAAQSTGGRSEACVLESLERLNRFEIDLTVRKPDGRIAYSFKGRLIDKLAWQTVPGDAAPSSRVLEVTIDPKMAVLFERNRFTYQDPKARCRRGNSPLALWLYGFLKSHRLRFSLSLTYLQGISRA
jgi:hypothetical protein